MVGMDTEVTIERSKLQDSLISCPHENGERSEEFEVVGGGGFIKGAALCPITPTPRRKNGEMVVVPSSPLSAESPQSLSVEGLNSVSSDEVVGSGLVDSPRTPEEGVFNPFAPGPEEMCLAPLGKKVAKECRRVVARRLNFDDVDNRLDTSEDDKETDRLIEKELVEAVYETLLEAIIMKQTEDFLAETDPLDLEHCRTPSSPAPLNGIAETCPGAPVKTADGKSLNIDPGLCRKLEF